MARSIKVTLELENNKFNRALKESDAQVEKFEKNTSGSFNKIGAAFAAIGGAALVKQIFTIGQTFQDLQTSLDFVTGSAKEGEAAFNNLTRLATQTQFGVEELVQTFIRLKGAGIEPTNDLLLTFADTASLAQDQLGVLNALTELFARAATKGKLELEDFNKIAERGVDVFKPLTKEFGLTIQEIQKLAETPAGQEQLFRGIQKALDDTYGGALQEKLKNSSVAFSNLEIALRRLADSTFKELGLNSTSAIEGLTEAINNLADNGKAITGIFNTLGAVLLFILNPFGKLKIAYQALTKAGGGVIGGLRNMIMHKKLSAEAVERLTKLFERFISVVGGAGLLAIYKKFSASTDENTESLKNNAHVLEYQTELERQAAIETAKLEEETAKAALAAEAFQRGYDNATKSVEKFKTEVIDSNDPLASYMEFFSNLLKETNDYLKTQENATIALRNLKVMFDDGFISLEAYNLMVEKLNSILGITEEEIPTAAFEAFNDIVDEVSRSTENYNLLMERLNELYTEGKINAEQFAQAKANLDTVFSENEAIDNFLETLGNAQKTLSQDLATAFLEGQNAGDSFKKFFKTLIQQIIADVLRLAIIQPILGAFLSPFGYGFGVGGNIIKLPGMAKGGPVMRNQPYVVGEKGPELFVPNTSGTIIPNGNGNQMGQATQITYNISAIDSASFEQRLAQNPEYLYNLTQVGARRQPA